LALGQSEIKLSVTITSKTKMFKTKMSETKMPYTQKCPKPVLGSVVFDILISDILIFEHFVQVPKLNVILHQYLWSFSPLWKVEFLLTEIENDAAVRPASYLQLSKMKWKKTVYLVIHFHGCLPLTFYLILCRFYLFICIFLQIC
jgi:hypothetical protein